MECNYISVILFVSVGCEWGQWVTGECSATCGEGIQTSTRTILRPAQYGGKACEGETSMEETCSNEECPPGNKMTYILVLQYITDESLLVFVH